MTKILIIEDHPIMSAGVAQLLLKIVPDMKVWESDNLKKAIEAAESEIFDLAIMDISIPGGDSVKMVEVFKKRWPETRILIFSNYDENLYALPFIKAGANGFISKKAPESDFRNAVETVLFRNKMYLSEALWENNLKRLMDTDKSSGGSFDKLSLKEQEIAQLFISGKGVSEIAGILNVSTSTINTHRVRIFQKIDVQNVMELAQKFKVLHG
jgi:two-component system invasion response regulator UvrY